MSNPVTDFYHAYDYNDVYCIFTEHRNDIDF